MKQIAKYDYIQKVFESCTERIHLKVMIDWLENIPELSFEIKNHLATKILIKDVEMEGDEFIKSLKNLFIDNQKRAVKTMEETKVGDKVIILGTLQEVCNNLGIELKEGFADRYVGSTREVMGVWEEDGITFLTLDIGVEIPIGCCSHSI